jgi:hypothetical protein
VSRALGGQRSTPAEVETMKVTKEKLPNGQWRETKQFSNGNTRSETYKPGLFGRQVSKVKTTTQKSR